MKLAVCMAAALSTMGAVAFVTPTSATAAPFGNIGVGTTSLVEQAQYRRNSRYYGARCKTVRKVIYRNGVRRVVIRRVCRR